MELLTMPEPCSGSMIWEMYHAPFHVRTNRSFGYFWMRFSGAGACAPDHDRCHATRSTNAGRHQYDNHHPSDFSLLI
jgi:hypothetical protein